MSEFALQLIETEKRERSGRLDLGNCGLTDIPKAVFELTWLEELSFSNEIWDWEKREWIKSENKGPKNRFHLKTLPGGFARLGNLKKLSFGGGIWQPLSIGQLPGAGAAYKLTIFIPSLE